MGPVVFWGPVVFLFVINVLRVYLFLSVCIQSIRVGPTCDNASVTITINFRGEDIHLVGEPVCATLG
jgi:hypothetical protein